MSQLREIISVSIVSIIHKEKSINHHESHFQRNHEINQSHNQIIGIRHKPYDSIETKIKSILLARSSIEELVKARKQQYRF